MPSEQRTLVFCTSYAETKAHWDERYRRWFDAVRRSALHYDQLLLVDDGSPCLPVWPELEIISANNTASGNMVLYHFADHRGRAHLFDFEGWYRSFVFAGQYAKRHGFNKIIHLESDAYFITRRVVEYCNSIEDGWVALWSPRYSMPETAIQLCTGDVAIEKYLNLPPYAMLKGALLEYRLPFDRVEKKFKGDRYGEYLAQVPRDADYVTQTRSNQADDYYWWL